MFASPRFGLAVLLLGVGMALAFAAGLAWGEVAFPSDVPLIAGGDGVSVSMLTGAYVPR